jgi:hypothetical protein
MSVNMQPGRAQTGRAQACSQDEHRHAARTSTGMQPGTSTDMQPGRAQTCSQDKHRHTARTSTGMQPGRAQTCSQDKHRHTARTSTGMQPGRAQACSQEDRLSSRALDQEKDWTMNKKGVDRNVRVGWCE